VNAPLLTLIVGLALGIVVVRRRSAAIALMAVQSLLIAAIAIDEAFDASTGLWIAAGILIFRGLLLPALLARGVLRTRERQRVESEHSALKRAVVAISLTLATVSLVPRIGLASGATEHTAFALIVLGLAIAALRLPVVFQVIGFIVAENGVYLASLGVHHGFPTVIELGLLFDLVVVLGVAVAFGDKIHEKFGTSDTSLLRSLRD
jgi:Hydrogenase 4 membrane component (E)